jgi:Fe2+ or Zn2+ uptake regulation protein
MAHQQRTTADRLLGSAIRVRLLRILLTSERRPWVRDLYRRVGGGMSSIRRELNWLVDEGMVRMRREGGAAFFDVCEHHPMVPALRELIQEADRIDSARGIKMPQDWERPSAGR